ncbi:uncharacterized protein BP5553_04490 [Venustampulla echinocandica]|uniref:Chromo domain-containing protein n=1 Tax=Venustampulla echinocandica TaxID=2656787 RepID=A0A370TNG4_9HELO|nr:uncharacterized protein BP5553_04490 [Venustampulla echinocandica]RDL37057.1 hypothetical protein BP5553_04490 [Venustampulla echinocandica]
MPPQLSDDEMSDDGFGFPIHRNRTTHSGSAELEKNGKEEAYESLMVESEDDEEEDEIGEDEFVPLKFMQDLGPKTAITGEIKFEVKWEGYEKKSDRTWEPEENLETASKILNEYLASAGGKEAIMEAYEEKKAELRPKKGRKRGRASLEANNGTVPKRGRKSHPESSTPPRSAGAQFSPPSGSWEDEITKIDACEGHDGEVVVYLTWREGHKTQHPLEQVYKRCPQKMLRFYQSHLVFKKSDTENYKNDSDDYKTGGAL